MKTDIEIAQSAKALPIEKIAEKISLPLDYLENYGKYKAKVDLSFYDDIKHRKDGKLILVTALTPTKAGEGKSTTTVGLVDGLASINKKVMGCLREPSLGPVFGVKVAQRVVDLHRLFLWKISTCILQGICMR